MRSLALLAAASAAAASRMPHELLANVTKDALRETLGAARFAGLSLAAFDALGAENQETAPQQLHLAVTNDPTEMTVVWITYGATTGPSVQWWPEGDASSPQTAAAATRTYNAGLWPGWTGFIYVATMTGLVPGGRYSYIVGSGTPGGATWSLPRTFAAPSAPSPTANTYIAVLADMGTIVPLGWAVADRVIQEHTLLEPFNLTTISGDLSYATVSPPKDEVEWTWDSWGLQNEPFTSTAPFMTVVGNHESAEGSVTDTTGHTTANVSFAAFLSRFEMPGNSSGGNANLWFSYDHGPLHITAMSTEHDYSVGSPQWTWIASDLAKAAARKSTATPWLVLMMHRPVYSADKDEWNAHQPGAPLSAALEPLLKQYGVDLVLQGHVHCYERIHPVYNGTVTALPGPNNTYTNPGAPLYIVQGTAGAVQRETFVNPPPAWSAVRSNGIYGFGRMRVTGGSRIDYEFADIYGEVQDSWAIVKSA